MSTLVLLGPLSFAALSPPVSVSDPQAVREGEDEGGEVFVLEHDWQDFDCGDC